MGKTSVIIRQLLNACFLTAFFFVYSHHLSGQSDSLKNKYPQNYFASPLDIPILLAGNFGELRSNHFHAGLDMKTQGREGLNIYASAEGWISRIKIQHGGYGKVLYIDHPNGYTTVYSHLKEFSPKIEKLVKAYQYQIESYTFDELLPRDSIKISKREVIALSGNSGGSGGPHLHYEIRETESEVPINPLLFGFNIQDRTPPIIRGIRIYPLSNKASVNQVNQAVYLGVQKSGQHYELSSTPMVSDKIGFGIETIDKVDGSPNRCGVFDIQLFIDSTLVFVHNTEKIPFHESRYINAHTDYAFKQTDHKWIHKSFIDPNNKLSTYKCQMYNGTYQFTESRIYHIKYIIKDAYGNQSILKFKVLGVQGEKENAKPDLPKDFKTNFNYFSENFYNDEHINVFIPEGALYDNIAFTLNKSYNPGLPLEYEFEIHQRDVPLHKNIDLYFKIDNSKVKHPSKLVAIRKVGNWKTAYTLDYQIGMAKLSTRYFGHYYLDYDLNPPSIRGRTVYNNARMDGKIGFSLVISDDLSGIEEYNAYVDGKWILMEYDYKKNRITHYFDGTIQKSSVPHKLKVIVSDAVGNESIYECDFYY